MHELDDQRHAIAATRPFAECMKDPQRCKHDHGIAGNRLVDGVVDVLAGNDIAGARDHDAYLGIKGENGQRDQPFMLAHAFTSDWRL